MVRLANTEAIAILCCLQELPGAGQTTVMTATLWLLTLAALAITFANGSNDNFKGVATLYGSGTVNYRRALAWATLTTLIGSLTSLILAGSLVARFSGRGLVPEPLTADASFLFAVGGGASVTVLLASWLGIPISTTHALTGGLVGAGILAAGNQLQLSALGAGLLIPLLVSPFVAAALVAAIYPVGIAFGRRWRIEADSCICVSSVAAVTQSVVPAEGLRVASLGASVITPVVAPTSECVVHGLSPITTARRVLDSAHYLSAGAVGFARGVNDTPKLVALLLPTQILAPAEGLLVVAIVMAVGGVLFARRVAETMSHRVTPMNPGQGFAANVITAALVLGASRFGLPVSTTHVSNGSLFGLGAIMGTARWRIITQILLAWLVTLPCSALCAALLWWLLN